MVQICLAKIDPNSSPAWKSLLVDQYEADPLVFDKMEQRLTLQKMEAQVIIKSLGKYKLIILC